MRQEVLHKVDQLHETVNKILDSQQQGKHSHR